MLIKKLYFFFILLIAITLPFPVMHFNSAIIIISFCISLFYFLFFERKKIWRNPYFLLFAGLYFMHYVAFINSTNTAPVFFDIEQKLAFLALPLIFALGPTCNQKQYRLIMTGFVAATFIVCLLSFRNGFYWGYSDSRLYENILMRHPYLGMYCVVCVFLCVHTMSFERKKIRRLIYLAVASFFVFFIAVLFAKMAIVAFAILTPLYLIGFLLQRRKYKLVTVFSLLLLTTISYLAFINSTGNTIFKKAISLNHFSWQEYDPMLVNSLNLRFIYWSCSAELLAKNKNWLFGEGTGDAQQALEDCYIERRAHHTIVDQHHDPHNQYLITWLSLGLIPLSLFIFHFLFLLYRYIKHKNLIAFIFTFGIMLFCITESIMENQKGIVFYALFQSLFMFGKDPKPLKNKN